MEERTIEDHIIEKLKSGVSFGLFEDGQKCYFRDGEKFRYTDLWKAVRIMFDLGAGAHNKTLFGLFPDTFEGVHDHRYSRHSWKRKTRQVS
ncbi:MAG: hypothetical protein H7257_13945 [Taibaiella sp.]|nr:hypothetical protein [Taibaiella sp.]